MIIDTSQGNTEVIGNIQEFKASIDPKNLEFITTILSSNLYSEPEKSFIREIVSNAWDSHVEAGTTDKPVIVLIAGKCGSYSITIRDYGTGLSPERFKEIYCNIGSSTKRDSNTFIGGFGLGRFSALSCSNTVHIRSYYNGVEYYYLMVKNGNSISINKVNETVTTEPNGLSVSIANLKNINDYLNGLSQITFFKNVYIDLRAEGIGNYYKYNNHNETVFKFLKKLAVCSVQIRDRALLGNVLYPINDRALKNQEAIDFLGEIYASGIAIRFNIGELNVTPNRESIIYTSETVATIENRILEAKDELYGKIRKIIAKDYLNLREYVEAVTTARYYNIFLDALSSRYCSNLSFKVLPRMFENDITFKGENIRDKQSLQWAMRREFPKIKGIIVDGEYKAYTGKPIVRYAKYYTLEFDRNILVIPPTSRITSVFKGYLSENFRNSVVMTEFSKEDLLKELKHVSKEQQDLIVDYVFSNIRKVSPEDPEFLKYKESVKKEKGNESKTVNSEVLLTINGFKSSFPDFEEAVKYLKKEHKGILLTDFTEDSNEAIEIASFRGWMHVKANQNVVKLIKERLPKYIVDLLWAKTKDRKLIEASTLLKYLKVPEYASSKLQLLLKVLPKEKASQISRIFSMQDSLVGKTSYRILARTIGEEDSYTKSICLEINKYFESLTKVENLTNAYTTLGSAVHFSLAVAVIIRGKYFRINNLAYNKCKSNDLIKILCRR